MISIRVAQFIPKLHKLSKKILQNDRIIDVAEYYEMNQLFAEKQERLKMNKTGYIIIAFLSAGIAKAEISKKSEANAQGKYAPCQQDTAIETNTKAPSNALDYHIRKNRANKRPPRPIKPSK